MAEIPSELPPSSEKKAGAPLPSVDNRSRVESLLRPLIGQPLEPAVYDRVFNGPNGWVPRSTEYFKLNGQPGPMLYKTAELLRLVPGYSRVLSIGAGDGDFDSRLHGDVPLEHYCAIEPNAVHARKLFGRVRGLPWKRSTVAEDAFHESFSNDANVPPGSFDAILWTHCAYFLKNVAAAVQHGQRFNAPGGLQIILHQTRDRGVCPLYRHFKERMNLQWPEHVLYQDHGMSTESISDQLREAGVWHFVGEEPSEVIVDDFFDDDASSSPGVRDLLTFIMHTDIDALPEDLRSAVLPEMIEWVRRNSERMPESGDGTRGKHCLPHPQGFLVVPHPSFAGSIGGNMREVR